MPGGEREEVRQIFGRKGFSGAELEQIVEVITSDEDRWVKTMAVERVRSASGKKVADFGCANTSVAFLICGIVPLASYLIAYNLAECGVATGLVFFAIGAMKSRWSPAPAMIRVRDAVCRDERSQSLVLRRLRAPEPALVDRGAGEHQAGNLTRKSCRIDDRHPAALHNPIKFTRPRRPLTQH